MKESSFPSLTVTLLSGQPRQTLLLRPPHCIIHMSLDYIPLYLTSATPCMSRTTHAPVGQVVVVAVIAIHLCPTLLTSHSQTLLHLPTQLRSRILYSYSHKQSRCSLELPRPLPTATPPPVALRSANLIRSTELIRASSALTSCNAS